MKDQMMYVDDSKKDIVVTNIQRMCFHDGPGIRTTVFLKGCNLHCPWCANPENIDGALQLYVRDGSSDVYGRYYSADELFAYVLKDKCFYKDGGGVTFSGGEPLLWAGRILSLLKSLNGLKINVAIETALHVDRSLWEAAAEYIDYYIVDIKILLPDYCSDIIGGSVDLFMDNVDFLYNRTKNIMFRIPLNHEYTMKEDNLNKIGVFLEKYNDIPVEIFATHSLGKNKYESLGLKASELKEVSGDELEFIAERFRNKGISVKINKL